MRLYTFAHALQVFFLGIILGFLVGGLLISRLKPGSTKVVFLRPVQRKIPSVETTEYPIVSSKNYKVV